MPISRVHRGSSACRRLLRSSEGAIYIESVVMLPFLMLLFGLVLYVHRDFSARHDASSRARQCAWAYAARGCSGPLPEGCRETGRRSSGELDDGSSTSVLATLSAIPLVGGFVDAFFGRIQTVASHREVARPRVIGGGTLRVGATYTTICNEAPPDTALDAAASMLRGFFE